MKKISFTRQHILVTGFWFVFLSFFCRPDLLKAFVYDLRFSSNTSKWILGTRIGMLIIGMALIIFRRRLRLQTIFQSLYEPLKFILAPFVIFVFVWVSVETISYVIFYHSISDHKRNNVYYALKLDQNLSETPLFIPNLWSNYAPNPLSPKVNKNGWRYGGGPRRHTKRILCIGGSTTWSNSVELAEESYPAQLEKYLQSKGYDIDVVNGGTPYYSSAEVQGALAFRGIYEKPDFVLIHTGENDIEPLLSSRPYQNDYRHWRSAESYEVGKNEIFMMLWHFPSWTTRLLSTLYLNPDGSSRHSTGRQLTTPQEAIFAETDLNKSYPKGLEMNLRSIIAITRAHKATPITLLFNANVNHPGFFINTENKNPKDIERGRQRVRRALDIDNEVMKNVSLELKVPVIPFNEFRLTSEKLRTDHCHLTAEGEAEKGKYIGDWLIQSQILGNPSLKTASSD